MFSLEMSEGEPEIQSATKCPVCGEELTGAEGEVQNHVNQHLDRHEEDESLALARQLEKRVSANIETPNRPAPSDQIEGTQIPQGGIESNDVEPADQMLRQLEISDEAYARSLHNEGEGALTTRLGESVSDSAELYFESIIHFILPLFDASEASILDPGISRRRVHLCSYMDMFCSNLAGVGWDCGYRNIQMMLSSLLFNEQYAALLALSGVKEVPSLPEIAGRLEKLLNNGNEEDSEYDTNGLLTETKVWIGASEAVELLQDLRVSANVKDFETPTNSERAGMFEWVYQQYNLWCSERNCGIHLSQRRAGMHGSVILEALVAPMYCQWQGHSVTIIGAEKSIIGEVSLIIVDPSRGFYDAVIDSKRHLSPSLFRRNVRHPQMQHPRFQIVYVEQVQALVPAVPRSVQQRARVPKWKRLLRKNDQPSTSSFPQTPQQETPFQPRTPHTQEDTNSSRFKPKFRRLSEAGPNEFPQSQPRSGHRRLFHR